MGKSKICVYAICKNEEKFVDRWMDSMGEADLVVVTDTGSTDDTVAKLRERGALVFEAKISPWRFDVARNVSLENVPQEYDICVCTDLDEEFEKGWRKKLDEALKGKKKGFHTQVRYTYNWSLKEDGTPGVQFIYSKIHSRDGYSWRHPVHEWIEYNGEVGKQDLISATGIVLNHYPDPSKSRGSYLPLLEMAVEEEPGNERMVNYLGREYMYYGLHDKCIETLKKYLKLPTATWNEERGAAMRWIANSYFKKNNFKQGKAWYFKAIAEAGHMREPFVEFARDLYHSGLNDWSMMHFLIHEALKIDKRSQTFTNQDYTWDHTPYDLGSLAAFYLGLHKRALWFSVKAVEHNPNDPRLLENRDLIIKTITNEKVGGD